MPGDDIFMNREGDPGFDLEAERVAAVSRSMQKHKKKTGGPAPKSESTAEDIKFKPPAPGEVETKALETDPRLQPLFNELDRLVHELKSHQTATGTVLRSPDRDKSPPYSTISKTQGLIPLRNSNPDLERIDSQLTSLAKALVDSGVPMSEIIVRALTSPVDNMVEK